MEAGTVPLIVWPVSDGSLGLFVEGCDYTATRPANCRFRTLIAHDILDHPDRHRCASAAGEIQAMGAMVFGRSFPAAKHRINEVTAALFIERNFIRKLVARDASLSASTDVGGPVSDSELQVLKSIAWASCKLAGGDAAVTRYQDAVLSHLLAGYCSARLRFGTPKAANAQFAAVVDACWPWLCRIESGDVPEGSRLILTYGSGAASINPSPT